MNNLISLANYPTWLHLCMGQLHAYHASDIFLNGINFGFVLTKKNKYIPFANPFNNIAQMVESLQSLANMCGQRLDPLKPTAGGEIGNYYRWHAVIPPASYLQPIFTLRYHEALLKSHINFNGEVSIKEKLKEVMIKRENILICGETGAGKTTLLGYLIKQYCRRERIIILEDVPELIVEEPLWIKLTTQDKNIYGKGQISFSDLISESLRLRPDRIICGEIRNINSIRFLELIYTGQQGCLSTFHAANATSAQIRLKKLCHENNFDLLGSSSVSKKLWGVFLKRGIPPTIEGISLLY